MESVYNDSDDVGNDDEQKTLKDGLLLSAAEIFWLTVWMFDDSRAGQYFVQSMRGIIRDAAIFDQLVKLYLPTLHKHLESHLLHPLMFVTPWFMTFFTCLPSWKTVLRFMDMFFLEGTTAIFRFALAIMVRCENDLLRLDSLDQLLPFLQRVPLRLCRASHLVPLACSLPIEELLCKSRALAERAQQQQQQQQQQQSRTPNRLPSQSNGSIMSPRTTAHVKKEQQQGLLSRFWSSIATPRRSSQQTTPITPRSSSKSKDKTPSVAQRSPSSSSSSSVSVSASAQRTSGSTTTSEESMREGETVGLVSPTHRSRVSQRSQRRAVLHDSLSILSASLRQSTEDTPDQNTKGTSDNVLLSSRTSWNDGSGGDGDGDGDGTGHQTALDFV